MALNPDRRRQARFEALALPHLDAAYALARWMTHNDVDAADVVQEAYLRAFHYLDCDRGGDAKSWFFKILWRTCYSWLERNLPRAAWYGFLVGERDNAISIRSAIMGCRRARHPSLRYIPAPNFSQRRNQAIDLLIGM